MSQRRVSWTIWGVSVAVTVVYLVVDAMSGDADIGEYAFTVFAILLYSTVGALITSRQVGNRVGVLFAWVGLSASISLLAGSYATLAQQRDLPLLAAAAWVGRVGFAAMFGPLAFLFLIFPTGRPSSRRWGWLLRVMLVAYAVMMIGFALTPGSLEAGFAELPRPVANPIGLPSSWKQPVETLTTIMGLVVALGALASVLSLIQRYRRAARLERQQIRWLAFLGVFLGIILVFTLGLIATGAINDEGVVSGLTFFAFIFGMFLGIPAVCGIAILRHGLWDLDVVVRKTVQYAVLLVTSLLVIALLVLLPGVLVVGLDAQTLPGVAIGVVAAAAFMLLRVPARRIANRIVYGKRSTPYEVLSEFAERVGETYSTDDVLPRMAQLLGQATGAQRTHVWLLVGGAMRADAGWPPDAPRPPDAVSRDGELPDFGGDDAFEVRHQGVLLGALTVTPAPSDPMDPSKEKLARDMASQAGLVLRNVRLIEELRESRRRIVAAQDTRAKKLERDIHDGAQQQLVALAVKLGLVERLVATDPDRATTMLAEAKAETNDALSDLRDLARGIYPPLLADKGLAAALEGQARKSPIPVEVEPDGIGRYPQETEAAVYFSCLEALQNVAKYANATRAIVRLAQTNGDLTFEVVDDGVGFDPNAAPTGSGLQGIADRLAAVGGSLEIRSEPGKGAVVMGRIRLGEAAR